MPITPYNAVKLAIRTISRSYNPISKQKERLTLDLNEVKERITRISEFSDLNIGDIQKATKTDTELNIVRQNLLQVSKDSIPPKYRKDYENYKTRNGIVYWKDRVVLPTDLRPGFLEIVHANHVGAGKMKELGKICL